MHHHMSRLDLLIAATAGMAIVVAALAGVPQTLGAHPWWAEQTGIIGGIAGAVLWLGLRRTGLTPTAQFTAAALSVLASAAAVHFGKQVFVASLADNTVAGRFWYFGWFALSGSVALLLAAAATLILRR